MWHTVQYSTITHHECSLTRVPVLNRVTSPMKHLNQLFSTILQQVFLRFCQILPFLESLLIWPREDLCLQPDKNKINMNWYLENWLRNQYVKLYNMFFHNYLSTDSNKWSLISKHWRFFSPVTTRSLWRNWGFCRKGGNSLRTSIPLSNILRLKFILHPYRNKKGAHITFSDCNILVEYMNINPENVHDLVSIPTLKKNTHKMLKSWNLN